MTQAFRSSLRPRVPYYAALVLALLGKVASAQELRVGQVLTLSGPNGAYGREIDQGTQACVRWLNEHGGIHGRMLKVLTRDDLGSPQESVAAAASLLDRDGAVLLFGPVGPAINTVLLPWAAKRGVVVLGPHAGDVVSRSAESSTAYFLTADYAAETERIVAHIQALAGEDVGIVYSDDALGRRVLETLEGVLAVAGLNTIVVAPLGDEAGAAANAARNIAARRPQALILATRGQSTVDIMRSLQRLWPEGSRGMTGVYGLSFSVTPRELAALGASARGLAVSQVLPQFTDSRQQLSLVYQEATRSEPATRSPAGLEGCLAPLVLAQVLKRSSADVGSSAGVLREFRSLRSVEIGNLELPLANRARPGLKFTDIVSIDPEGRVLR